MVDGRLDDLLLLAARLSEVALRRVRSKWDAEDEWDRRLVWRRVERALRETGRRRTLDEFRERVRRWTNDVPSVLAGGFTSEGVAPPESSAAMHTIALRALVAPALIDAAAAVVVGDRLLDNEKVLLTGPFEADDLE